MTIFQKFTNLIKKDLKRWTTTIAEVSQAKTPRIVGYWMGGIAAMAFGAVSLGGVTRLTESGLSMVKFIICCAGIIPKSSRYLILKFHLG